MFGVRFDTLVELPLALFAYFFFSRQPRPLFPGTCKRAPYPLVRENVPYPLVRKRVPYPLICTPSPISSYAKTPQLQGDQADLVMDMLFFMQEVRGLGHGRG